MFLLLSGGYIVLVATEQCHVDLGVQLCGEGVKDVREGGGESGLAHLAVPSLLIVFGIFEWQRFAVCGALHRAVVPDADSSGFDGFAEV
jgi:hypothetical protein